MCHLKIIGNGRQSNMHRYWPLSSPVGQHFQRPGQHPSLTYEQLPSLPSPPALSPHSLSLTAPVTTATDSKYIIATNKYLHHIVHHRQAIVKATRKSSLCSNNSQPTWQTCPSNKQTTCKRVKLHSNTQVQHLVGVIFKPHGIFIKSQRWWSYFSTATNLIVSYE